MIIINIFSCIKGFRQVFMLFEFPIFSDTQENGFVACAAMAMRTKTVRDIFVLMIFTNRTLTLGTGYDKMSAVRRICHKFRGYYEFFVFWEQK